MLICPYMYESTIPIRGCESTFRVFLFSLVLGKAWLGGDSSSLFQRPAKHPKTLKRKTQKVDSPPLMGMVDSYRYRHIRKYIYI